jgi:hypothetical protein
MSTPLPPQRMVTECDMHTRAEMWFSSDFLAKPPGGWTVDWDHVDHTTPRPIKLGETMYDRDEYEDPSGYMAGILVRHEACGRVWRLTGDEAGCGDCLLGRWPD